MIISIVTWSDSIRFFAYTIWLSPLGPISTNPVHSHSIYTCATLLTFLPFTESLRFRIRFEFYSETFFLHSLLSLLCEWNIYGSYAMQKLMHVCTICNACIIHMIRNQILQSSTEKSFFFWEKRRFQYLPRSYFKLHWHISISFYMIQFFFLQRTQRILEKRMKRERGKNHWRARNATIITSRKSLIELLLSQ